MPIVRTSVPRIVRVVIFYGLFFSNRITALLFLFVAAKITRAYYLSITRLLSLSYCNAVDLRRYFLSMPGVTPFHDPPGRLRGQQHADGDKGGRGHVAGRNERSGKRDDIYANGQEQHEEQTGIAQRDPERPMRQRLSDAHDEERNEFQ